MSSIFVNKMPLEEMAIERKKVLIVNVHTFSLKTKGRIMTLKRRVKCLDKTATESQRSQHPSQAKAARRPLPIAHKVPRKRARHDIDDTSDRGYNMSSPSSDSQSSAASSPERPKFKYNFVYFKYCY